MSTKIIVALAMMVSLGLVGCDQKPDVSTEETQITKAQQDAINSVDQPNPQAIAVEEVESSAVTSEITEQ